MAIVDALYGQPGRDMCAYVYVCVCICIYMHIYVYINVICAHVVYTYRLDSYAANELRACKAPRFERVPPTSPSISWAYLSPYSGVDMELGRVQSSPSLRLGGHLPEHVTHRLEGGGG